MYDFQTNFLRDNQGLFSVTMSDFQSGTVFSLYYKIQAYIYMILLPNAIVIVGDLSQALLTPRTSHTACKHTSTSIAGSETVYIYSSFL